MQRILLVNCISGYAGNIATQQEADSILRAVPEYPYSEMMLASPSWGSLAALQIRSCIAEHLLGMADEAADHAGDTDLGRCCPRGSSTLPRTLHEYSTTPCVTVSMWPLDFPAVPVMMNATS